MTIKSIDEYTTQQVLEGMKHAVREINEANGWWDDERTFGEDIALLHSEVSEMLEAFRDYGLDDATAPCEGCDVGIGSHDQHTPIKPEGVGSEAADILIRLLDTCDRNGIILAYEFRRKLAYNRTRGHKHGGKKL